ncbi:hypothetical protein OHW82_13280 [Acinetobacter baumannii]|nr:hypothetical protein [Acinetobacter baumannii]
MLKSEIDELLIEVKETFEHVKSYRKITKPKVKTILEHLRTCLEYSAQDISTKLGQSKNKKLYFPYGNSLKNLEENTDKYLTSLRSENPDIFNEIVELHAFKYEGSWMKVFCDMTNHVKHVAPLDIRQDSEIVKDIKIEAEGVKLFRVGSKSTLIVDGMKVRGKSIDEFKVNRGRIEITKKGESSIFFKISKERKILVGDQQLDLLPFLETSIYKIESFINNLYKII